MSVRRHSQIYQGACARALRVAMAALNNEDFQKLLTTSDATLLKDTQAPAATGGNVHL